MLKIIIDLLENANGETENIRIAQGKYKLAGGFKESYNQFKKELLWLKK